VAVSDEMSWTTIVYYPREDMNFDAGATHSVV
jgi:hypothetical protein